MTVFNQDRNPGEFLVETRTIIFEVDPVGGSIFKAEPRTILFGVPFQASTSGEVNTGANVGTGAGLVFRDKTGAVLNFRRLKGLGSLTVAVNGDDIELSAAGGAWFEDEFSPTAGQTVFALTQAPSDANSIQVYVNGVLYDDVTDYTVAGSTLTWLDPFVLEVGDKVLVRYV